MHSYDIISITLLFYICNCHFKFSNFKVIFLWQHIFSPNSHKCNKTLSTVNGSYIRAVFLEMPLIRPVFNLKNKLLKIYWGSLLKIMRLQSNSDALQLSQLCVYMSLNAIKNHNSPKNGLNYYYENSICISLYLSWSFLPMWSRSGGLGAELEMIGVSPVRCWRVKLSQESQQKRPPPALKTRPTSDSCARAHTHMQARAHTHTLLLYVCMLMFLHCKLLWIKHLLKAWMWSKHNRSLSICVQHML